MEFNNEKQAYVTQYLDLPNHGVTDEDAVKIGSLLQFDDKFEKVE